MSFTTLTCTLNDVPTDATSVVLASVSGTYGIINPATGAVVMPNNTATVLHYLPGVYKYDVSALTAGVEYQVSWGITYNDSTHYATASFTLGTAPQLSDVKTYLRIDSTDMSFDTEVQDMISAAQSDLIEVGVNPDVFNSGDPLIRRAITTYCKANFGYDTDNAAAFASAFEKLKIFLMNCSDYQPLVVDLDNFGGGVI
jgi:hypothetical protein